jgi:hypothetical protein
VELFRFIVKDRQLASLDLRREAAVELEAAEQEGWRAAAGLRLEVQEQRERCLGPSWRRRRRQSTGRRCAGAQAWS